MNADTTLNNDSNGPDDPQKTLPSEPVNPVSPKSSANPWCPGGYEILGRLGAGGNGQVFKARHLGLERIVALKRLLNPAANRDERERFLAEARAVARLDHPNIIRIHDFGIHESVEWYSLEFCQRGSLADRLREGPMPLETSCQSILTVARAVGHAHAEGIIHRDIKPGNVLIANGNILKLADFGLAKAADARHSGDNVIAGTPSYMAPEQISAPGRIGPATDVWALGVMLYECLTGRVPFTGVTVLQVMQRITGAEPVPPRLLNDAIPLDLNTICLHALRKDPDKRYRTTSEMAADLEAWLEGRPIAVRAVTRLERGLKWSRRNPALAWSLASLAGAILLGTSSSIVFGLVALREARLLKEEQERSSQALAEARRLERLTRLSAAQAAWDKFQWHRFLALIAPKQGGEAPLFEESLWRARAGIDREPLSLASRPGVSTLAPGGPAWPLLASGDNGRAAWMTREGAVDGLEHSQPARVLAINGKGNAFVLTNAGEILAFSPTGNRLKTTPPGPWNGMVVEPSGAMLARWNDLVLEVLAEHFKAVQVLTGIGPSAVWATKAPVLAVAWSAPGKIDLIRPNQPLRTITGAMAPMAISPDGKYLVAAGGDKLHRWNTETGERDPAFEPRLGHCRFLRFDSNGTGLLAAGGSEIRLLDGSRGRGLQYLTTPGTAIEGMDLAPEGIRCLTWGDGIAQLWNLVSGQQEVFRGVTGPAKADWKTSTFVHPSMEGDHWEIRSQRTANRLPQRVCLGEGWIIRRITRRSGNWIVEGIEKGAPAAVSLGADGTVTPMRAVSPPDTDHPDFRLSAGMLEKHAEGSWKRWARRQAPIGAWAFDSREGVVGFATEQGRVERIDAKTGMPLWEEAGPENPLTMAMNEGGVAVAAPGGWVWIWQAH